MEKENKNSNSPQKSGEGGGAQTKRPPVVVVLGHIDSGKTTLLDQIRKSQVAKGESGGITQHIGAYQIEKKGRKITFIDTPGHEAFSQMRSRGAKVADIAILVIDSCKGVEAQTKEVMSHIEKTGLPTVVAFNKIDKPAAFPQKAKKQLQKEGIVVESLGGEVPSVKVSAKTGEGVEDLLDLILIISEMEDFKADVSKQAEGAIIESYLDNKRGPTATIILNNGKIEIGTIIATPSTFGKIKILEDFQGQKLSEVLPGDPAVVLGLEETPLVGEKFKSFPDIEKAKTHLQPKKKEEKIQEQKLAEVKDDQRILNIILKTDVIGSIEAIQEVLRQLPQEKIILQILKAEVGDITQNDIKLAENFQALVIGFRVEFNPGAKKLIQREETKVKVLNFGIIYELVEEIRKIMEKMLAPEVTRVNVGTLKVLKTFWSKKNRQIVGGRITEGNVTKGLSIEVSRNDEVIDQGKLIDLQKNKQPINKASRGEEIGMLYEGNKKIEKGDTLTFYTKEKQKGEL